MDLDRIYIEEAIRIRKEFLYNMSFIDNLEPQYEKLLVEFEKAKEQIDDIDREGEDKRYNKDYLIDLLDKLNTHINETVNKIKPYTDAIKVLDEDHKVLYRSIKEKYPNITDEEMKESIIPYIINL